jgi:hypothetical protein
MEFDASVARLAGLPPEEVSQSLEAFGMDFDRARSGSVIPPPPRTALSCSAIPPPSTAHLG